MNTIGTRNKANAGQYGKVCYGESLRYCGPIFSDNSSVIRTYYSNEGTVVVVP